MEVNVQNLQKFRIHTDADLALVIKDAGDPLDWREVKVVDVQFFSEAQEALAGRGCFSVDPENPQLLRITYPAGRQIFLGDYRVVVTVDIYGKVASFDALCFTLVENTEDLPGGSACINVSIELADIDPSVLSGAIRAAREAAEQANASMETFSAQEDQRALAESERKSNETTRKSAETRRNNAEASRESSETSRVSAENVRAEAESYRRSAEDVRVYNEEARRTQDEARARKDAEYASAELDRYNAEQARIKAEELRAHHEDYRESNESRRDSQETGRINSEASRVSSENARTSNEWDRMTAERGRSEAEAQRQAAEEQRNQTFAASEQTRQETFDSKEAERDAATAIISQEAEKLTELERKTDNISAEEAESESEVDEIVIEDNDGNEVVNITPNGVDCKNLKSNGEDVLTQHQDISGLATKAEVESKQDIIPQVSQEETTDETEEVEFGSDDYDNSGNGEKYASIGSYGIKAKAYFDLHGNLVFSQSGEGIVSDAQAIRTIIKDKFPYYFSQYEGFDGSHQGVAPTTFDTDAYADRFIRDIPKGKHFLFVTDTHFPDASRTSNYMIDYVRRRIGVNKVVFGGDAITSYSGDKARYIAAQALSNYSEDFFATFGKHAIYCQGNHDGNFAGWNRDIEPAGTRLIPSSEIFKRTLAHLTDEARFDEDLFAVIDSMTYSEDDKNELKAFLHNTYYVDDTLNKVRFIVFDTGIGDYTQYKFTGDGYASSVSFFYKTLVKFLNTTPNDYDIVLCGHELGHGEEFEKQIHAILIAYKLGLSSVICWDWSWKSFVGINIFKNVPDMQSINNAVIGDESLLWSHKNGIRYVELYKYSSMGWVDANEGYYCKIPASESDLVAEIPNPSVGDKCLVGSSNGYTLFECLVDGDWSSTSITYSSNPIAYGVNSPLYSNLRGETINGKFTISGFNTPHNNRIFSIGGHYHEDMCMVYDLNKELSIGAIVDTNRDVVSSLYENTPSRKNGSVISIVTDTDSFQNGSGGLGTHWEKVRNSINDTIFDIVTIIDDSVVLNRFGIGLNRIYNI